MLEPIIYVIVGFTMLVWGADRFISGASATARNLGVSPLIIGLTIIGFGTSAPEMVVSAVASARGNPGLAIGNAIGSNIANIALILGITALVYPLSVQSRTLKREYPILILVTLGTGATLLNGVLDRIDGILLLTALFATTAWMAWLGVKRDSPDPLASEYAAEIPSDMSTKVALGWLAMGLVVLPLSSHILVLGAVAIAIELGVADVVIGLTIVAIGTSLPELAAAIASAVKREHDLAIGNIIGSNMFNLLGVLGIAGTIHPAVLPGNVLVRDYVIMLGLTLLLFLLAYGFKGRPGRIRRGDGVLLLTAFVGYQLLVYFTEIA